MYYVFVTDHGATFCYGPFDNKDKAKEWTDKFVSDFSGRTIHIQKFQPIAVQ